MKSRAGPEPSPTSDVAEQQQAPEGVRTCANTQETRDEDVEIETKSKHTGDGSNAPNDTANLSFDNSNVPIPPTNSGPSFTDRNAATGSQGPSVGESDSMHTIKPSAGLSLSIDTSNSTLNTPSAYTRSQRSPRSPLSPKSTDIAPKGSTSQSPLTPPLRARGFSLRRSLLVRNVPGQSQPDHGTVIELDSVEGSSSLPLNPQNSTLGASPPIAEPVSIDMSPIMEYTRDEPPSPPSAKKQAAPVSLPHYQSWANKKSTARKISRRFKGAKEKVRKTILRIQSLPPSKDGRHIPLVVSRRKALVDDRRGHEYINNTIRSTRHTLYNFIPRQLFAQFYKLANFYFLCVSILQMIPGLSTTGTYTTLVPLLFFVCISIAKEGYDDLRRHRLDRAENRRLTSVLRENNSTCLATSETGSISSLAIGVPKHWTKVKWHDVKVGDVVKIERDEPSPADLVILNAKGTDGVAYIETMALDGETNLKIKQPASSLKELCQTPNGISRCRAEIIAEDPNLDLYNFEGKLTVGEETVPLTNNEIVYRGSILRNTSEIMGMVLYTGEECKIRMNATKNPRIKAPALQYAVNKIVVIIVIFVLALAIFNTVAYQIWRSNTEDEAWYLTNAGVAFFPILASFIILFNTMIPLSLYVSLEIVKLCQMLLMNDIDMYDEPSNTPMEARTSTINEDLGQVNYIFSDKTGTLTNNSMRFRKMSVAGTAWLHDTDVQMDMLKRSLARPPVQSRRSKGKEPIRSSKDLIPRSFSTEPVAPTYLGESPVGRNSSVTSHPKSSARPQGTHQLLNTSELIQYIQRRPHTNFARQAQNFILSIALCHTCFPETKEGGEIAYQAASPDEQALVIAAQELGYVVTDRHNATITIRTTPLGADSEPILERYQILDVIEFSSARKRMSIIVRMPNQRICVFCKGADSTITQLLRLSKLANAKAVEVEQRVSKRQSLEAQQALRRASEARSRKNSLARKSLSLHRPSMAATRLSINAKRLQPIRDELDQWLSDRENLGVSPVDSESVYYSPRPSGQLSVHPDRASNSFEMRSFLQRQGSYELVDESMVVDDPVVFERCFQHINDFATEGLRTLLYGYRYLGEEEYRGWKKLYHDATTSLIDRQERIEKAGAIIERDLELAGATAIEDKLQDAVPETIDKLRRAGIKLWMLTGDKRETAINIGHSCRLIKDYSTVTILDRKLGDVNRRMAAAIIDIDKGGVAHSVVVIDGQTLNEITSHEPLRKLFLSLTILVDTVVCCRASPSQKASLVHSIRRKVKKSVTLAIGDGANDIAMIQEAHVGIGITGKEGLQAARSSDYSIAQFRFLAKLLFVHGRWNYVRTCKYTLGTFWKEMLFYLTQALLQRYAGYTGTSLYESWSLSMFNTLFTSLPVIFMGVFEQDLSARTLMAVPELYSSMGPRNAGFNMPLYLGWVFMASSNAVIVFFIMLGLYGQALFTLDNGLFAMGALSYSSCVIVIAMKLQFWEIHNKNITCAIAIFLSLGGWFLWNIILSATYHDNVIYNVKDGLLARFGRNALWWLTLILIVTACWAMEICVKAIKCSWMPRPADCFRELEKDEVIRQRFARASGLPMDTQREDPAVEESLQRVRTAKEEKQRETEVQEILGRPRHMRVASGADEEEVRPSATKRRATLEGETTAKEPKVSFAVADRDIPNDDDDDNGKQKARRRNTDVSEMLRKGFGSVRRSLDIV